MGYLLHIFLAVGIQVLGEAGIDTGFEAPWAFLALIAVPHLLARYGRKAFLRGQFARALLMERVVNYSALGVYLIFVSGCSWIETVRRWTSAELSLHGWPEPAILLALAPFVVLQLLAIDATASIHDTRAAERKRVRTFHTRMFLSGLLPVLIYIVISSGVGWNESVRVHVERVALYNAFFVAFVLFILVLFLPVLLRNTWETAELEPSVQRELLENVAERADFSCSKLLKWKTGFLMANAAIVGFLPRQRVVLFSDSLLSMLSLRELAAVFAHEIGHAKRHHVAVFVAWALAFALGGLLLVGWLGIDGDWRGAAVGTGVLVAWVLGFGWLSRRFELEADLYSLDLLHDPDAMAGALERVGGRLKDISGWRHFSAKRRIDFILSAWQDKRIAVRLRRTLRFWSVVGCLCAAAAISAHVWQLSSSFAVDRVFVELSLGRYERAAALTTADMDEDVRALVDVASELRSAAGRDLTEADLETELELRLEQGRAEGALRVAELLALRGREELFPVIEALDALVQRDKDFARLLEGVAAPWKERVGRLR